MLYETDSSSPSQPFLLLAVTEDASQVDEDAKGQGKSERGKDNWD